VVGSQIGIFTLDPSFGHNLCFKYSNGSLQAHFRHLSFKTFSMELFNPMSFDPWNTSLKIHDSIGIPTHTVRIHLGVCGFIPSHSQECECDYRVALSACTFPCLCFGHEPKVKVVTFAPIIESFKSKLRTKPTKTHIVITNDVYELSIVTSCCQQN